jgi:hypothetical protein
MRGLDALPHLSFIFCRLAERRLLNGMKLVSQLNNILAL